jgi:hypothetical protein
MGALDETEVAGENTNYSLNISNINFYSWNSISSSAPMERRKSVYVKFIEMFWIWQDVYGINDSRTITITLSSILLDYNSPFICGITIFFFN